VRDLLDYFSPDYAAARERFRATARVVGAVSHTLELAARGPRGEPLTIDIAWLGEPKARRILLHSSGLHGVEAFAGSAVQLALLAHPPALGAGCALVLAHTLNPYGMAWLRRVNEHNVDLNRNFLTDGEIWSGAPDIYRRIERLLNPPSPPGIDLMSLRVLLPLARYGFQRLKQAIAEGQYEYERGLFYGGRRLEQGPRQYLDWIAKQLGEAQYVFALDVHTGLGRWGEETLLPEPQVGATPIPQLAAALERELTDVSQPHGAAYVIRGSMGRALTRVLPQAAVDFVLQELGTVPPFAVFRALREENRLHHHGSRSMDHPVKRRLREALCPASPRWREQVVARGVALAERAALWTFSDRAG
jgi:hypothetical protein